MKYLIGVMLLLFLSPGAESNPPAVLSGTAPEEKMLYQFGVLTDLRYCECPPSEDKYPKNSLDKLKMARDEMNAKKPAFVIHLGNAIEQELRSFEPILTGMAHFDVPFHNLLGNRDYAVKDIYKEMISPVLDMAAPYYEFSRQGWRFFMLDGNDLSFYSLAQRNRAKKKETDNLFGQITLLDYPQAHPNSGGIGHSQKKWLTEGLESARLAGERVILFCHFPIYPAGQYNLWNDDEILKIIDQYPNIAAVFSGQNPQGNYASRRGVHFLSLKTMVHSESQPAFSLVQLFPHQIHIKGYGRETDYQWTFEPLAP